MSDFEKVYSIEFRIAKALKDLTKLDKVLEKIEDNKLIKIFGSMERKLKSFEKQAAKTGKVLDKKLNQAAKRTAKNVDKIGDAAKRSNASLKALGSGIKRYAMLPMAAFGAASIKASLDINKAMGNVETLLSDKGAIQGLKRGVQDMAKETGKSTTDLADGLYQVVSALGESSDNMDQLSIASRAAVAGVAETADAVQMLSAVGKGYNDVSAESLKRTSDLAFQTVKLGVTTFPELAASMGKVVPLAAAMNTSQEELFGTMATLTGVTGNTSEVVTQLSSVYSAFMKPGGAMKDAMASINKENEEYNFSSASMMLKTLGLKKSLELLNKTADGNADALTAIFKRKEAVLAVLPLMSTQSENYTKKLKAMEDAVGATDEAYRVQTEGINAQGHSWEKTKQRMIVFAQRVGDRLLPIIDKIGDKLEPIIAYLEEMDEEFIATAMSVATFALKLMLVYKSLKFINDIGGGVASMFNSMAGEVTSLGNSAQSAGGKVGKLGDGLSKLQKGVGLLGAAALGYTLGGLIADFDDRADAARLKKSNETTMTARKATRGNLRKMSDAELDQAIAESRSGSAGAEEYLDKRRKYEKTKSQLEGVGKGNLAGVAPYIPEDRLTNLDSLKRFQTEKQNRATGKEIMAGTGGPVGTNVFGQNEGQARGTKSPTINMGNTTVNAGASKAQINEAVKKAQDKERKKLMRQFQEADDFGGEI